MDFEYSDRCKDYLKRVEAFMDAYVYEGNEIYHRQHEEFGPGEGRWKIPPIIEELKAKAKAEAAGIPVVMNDCALRQHRRRFGRG